MNQSKLNLIKHNGPCVIYNHKTQKPKFTSVDWHVTHLLTQGEHKAETFCNNRTRKDLEWISQVSSCKQWAWGPDQVQAENKNKGKRTTAGGCMHTRHVDSIYTSNQARWTNSSVYLHHGIKFVLNFNSHTCWFCFNKIPYHFQSSSCTTQIAHPAGL
jgi:hypothetical protein